VLVRVVSAIRAGLDAIRTGDTVAPAGAVTLAELTDIFGIGAWDAVDDRHGARND
jgi:hypothetical protein